ncbi:MAG: ParB/RepB/Spo0J family partition protein [Verrucomicrobia bacterium]|nr:ParB/RepB/Spo0J family partition protein [Verrucomicrobiota bacterium]
MAKHAGLGRGLDALIKEVPTSDTGGELPGGITRVPIHCIHKNPWQPRRQFSPEALEDLVRSIREQGVLQPLLVREIKKSGDDRTGPEYELIAGERRLRSAHDAELKEVPVIIMDVSDREALELALVENLQREDLNIVDEAEGYQALADKFEMTQEQIAQRVGKGRATVANAVRILSLPDGVKTLVSANRLSAGHAKALLGLSVSDEQELLAQRTVKEGLSVRAVEKIVAKTKLAPRKPRTERSDIPASHLQHITEQLHQRLGTSVRVAACKTLANGKKARGRIEIDFYSTDDLDRLLVILGLSDDF